MQIKIAPAYKKPLVFFLFVVVALIASNIKGYPYDYKCFKSWALHIFHNGLSKAYTIWDNYMPFYQYVLWVFGKMAGSAVAIVKGIYYLKIFTLAFDFAGLWFVYKWLDEKVDFLVLVLGCILNVAFSYNTVIWGQTDGIYSALVFVSLYYAWRQKVVLSVVWYVIAVNMKIQAIIFLPMLGLLLLSDIKKNWWPMLLSVFVAGVLQLVLLMPFLMEQGGFDLFWNNVIVGATKTHPMLVSGAFNFWHFVAKEPTMVHDDTIFILGLSYNKVGFILFAVFSALALYPLMRHVGINNLGKSVKTPVAKELVFIAGSLIAILFFYFNTEMHERYSHPAFLFIAAYSFMSKDFVPYIVFSIAYLLNMERVFQFLGLNNYSTILFDFRFVAALYGVVIIYLFYRLFQLSKKAA